MPQASCSLQGSEQEDEDADSLWQSPHGHPVQVKACARQQDCPGGRVHLTNRGHIHNTGILSDSLGGTVMNSAGDKGRGQPPPAGGLYQSDCFSTS